MVAAFSLKSRDLAICRNECVPTRTIVLFSVALEIHYFLECILWYHMWPLRTCSGSGTKWRLCLVKGWYDWNIYAHKSWMFHYFGKRSLSPSWWKRAMGDQYDRFVSADGLVLTGIRPPLPLETYLFSQDSAQAHICTWCIYVNYFAKETFRILASFNIA